MFCGGRHYEHTTPENRNNSFQPPGTGLIVLGKDVNKSAARPRSGRKTAEGNYQQALAVCENAQINFERTAVYAPVNGYVTNLVLDVGDYADAGKPVLAVVTRMRFKARHV
jgi:multidrug resistance efflux pump